MQCRRSPAGQWREIGFAYITHGVLSGEAVNRVNNSQLEKLLITDTIQPTEAILRSDKFGVIKIAELIGEAMRRTTDEHSVSAFSTKSLIIARTR